MPYRPKATGPDDPFTTSEKVMQTFRIPRELVTFLKVEANATGRDLTAYVNRMLYGVKTYYGLPQAVIEHLEADRAALKMERYDYFLHVLYKRSNDVIQKGPGFDTPGSGEGKKKQR